MTKDEKIREVYGDYKVKIDENGWTNFMAIAQFGSHNLDSKVKNEKLIYRHKSLQGIETNNGWIKIESEDDLPKESSNYWIQQSDGRIQTIKEYFDNKEYYNITATGYQEIIKPRKQIY